MEPDKKYKCFECKQLFYGKDLIEYASPGSITFKRYCEPCLAEKKRRCHYWMIEDNTYLIALRSSQY